MEPANAFVDDLIDLDETTDLPVIPRRSKRSFGIRIGEADDTLQILDLANLDMTLDLAPAGSSSSSGNLSSVKNVKELSCYTNDFSSINEMDMAFVGSTLDQSSVLSVDHEDSAIEVKPEQVNETKSEKENLVEELDKEPSILPINLEDIDEKLLDQNCDIGDLIQLSDASIELAAGDTIDEKQKPIEIDEAVPSEENLSIPIADEVSELIKFDDDDFAECITEPDSVEMQDNLEKIIQNCEPSSSEDAKENSVSEALPTISNKEEDEVFSSQENVKNGEEENEGESGEIRLLDITNFVFPSPLPKAGCKNKSLLGNNSSINLMDMSLSKLNCSDKGATKEKFSTPKPCLKSTSNSSSDDNSSITVPTNHSRRKSKSVSFQSPGIYFATVKRLSNIRKTPIRRSINRFTGKTLKTPDSLKGVKQTKFSTPNRFISSPGASPFTVMVTKFSKLALATPTTTNTSESRIMNEEVSSINLFLSDSCDGEQSETSMQLKSDTSDQCLRL